MNLFTLVSTVFNENRRLAETIGDIEAQSLKPTQIVIVDAGSTDGTFETLQSWSKKSSIEIVVLQKRGCNVAEGRNLAILNSKFDIIVSTDFGCRFNPEWLVSLMTPFNNVNVRVVGGAYSVNEYAIVSLASKANFILTNGYKVNLDEGFIPSSRSIAYYKSVWKEVGRYCEWLTLAADDLVFGKAIRSQGIPIYLVHEPYVFWSRHERAKSYGKEAFRYGLGDGEARVNLRNTISNFVETGFRYLLFCTFLLFLVNQAKDWIPDVYFLLAVPLLAGLRSYRVALTNWISLRSSKYKFIVFLFSLLLIEITRINYLKGYVRGYFFSSDHVKSHAKSLAPMLK